LAQPAGDERRSPGYASYQRANRMFTEKRYQDAMNLLDEALRLDPALVPALTLRSKLAMAINRYDVARRDLEKAIAADPSAWYARFLY
jgi:tetratricopeptide (TPR) repeat protein